MSEHQCLSCSSGCAAQPRPHIGAQHDVGIEYRKQAFEVSAAGRGQEGVYDGTLLDNIGVPSPTKG